MCHYSLYHTDLLTKEVEGQSHFSSRMYVVKERIPNSFIHSTNIRGAYHILLESFVSGDGVGQTRLLFCWVGDPGEVHLNSEPGLTGRDWVASQNGNHVSKAD